MKILVRAPNWVGDAVMAIPALEAIRRTHTAAEIAILARPGVADLYRDQPFANKIWEYENSGRHKGWWGREKLVGEVRRERFDLAVLLQNAFEAAWLAWRAGIPERIGYARDARALLLTKAVKVPQAGEIPPHESYYYLEMLRRAGWVESQQDIAPIRLQIAASARESAEVALRRAGAKEGRWRCAIAPGASYGAAKCWPPERFAAVADRLISECGADVIFFGTPNEKGIVTRISSAMKCRAIS